jgi:hypothetical protein
MNLLSIPGKKRSQRIGRYRSKRTTDSTQLTQIVRPRSTG